MPTLTFVTRGTDACRSTWRHPTMPDTTATDTMLCTPAQVQAILRGETPPRPGSIDPTWLFVSADLICTFSNGQFTLNANEIGDVSGYLADGSRAPMQLRGVIAEVGQPVRHVRLAEGEYTIAGDQVTTLKETPAFDPADPRTSVPYRIIGNTATKVTI